MTLKMDGTTVTVQLEENGPIKLSSVVYKLMFKKTDFKSFNI